MTLSSEKLVIGVSVLLSVCGLGDIKNIFLLFQIFVQ